MLLARGIQQKFAQEMAVLAALLAGYALALITVGDYETARAVLFETNGRDALVKLAAAHVALQHAAKRVFDDVKEAKSNPLMLAVRAGKLGGVAAVKAYCEQAMAGNMTDEVEVARVAEAEPLADRGRDRRVRQSGGGGARGGGGDEGRQGGQGAPDHAACVSAGREAKGRRRLWWAKGGGAGSGAAMEPRC